MARLPRYFVKSVPLHIILRGSNREPIFANDEDCQFFKEELLDAAKLRALAIHAHVFMTNNIHLLASPGTDPLSPSYVTQIRQDGGWSHRHLVATHRSRDRPEFGDWRSHV